jgi:hypothetical protein
MAQVSACGPARTKVRPPPLEEDPDDSFSAFVRREFKSGRRVVVTAGSDNLLSHLRRLVRG